MIGRLSELRVTTEVKLGAGSRRWRSDQTATEAGPMSVMRCSLEIEQGRAMLIDQLEHASAAAGDAGERIFGDDHRQTGLFHE